MASPSIFISIAGSPPRLVDGELCIEGELLNLDDEDDGDNDDTNSIRTESFITGPIIQRINSRMIKTRNQIYILEGQMAMDIIEKEESVDTPHFIGHRFSSGVPSNWERLVQH